MKKRSSKENRPGCMEYWLKRGFNEEEAKKQVRMRNPGCLEYYIYFKKMNHSNYRKSYL
jgi:hypothetical protein